MAIYYGYSAILLAIFIAYSVGYYLAIHLAICMAIHVVILLAILFSTLFAIYLAKRFFIYLAIMMAIPLVIQSAIHLEHIIVKALQLPIRARTCETTFKGKLGHGVQGAQKETGQALLPIFQKL